MAHCVHVYVWKGGADLKWTGKKISGSWGGHVPQCPIAGDADVRVMTIKIIGVTFCRSGRPPAARRRASETCVLRMDDVGRSSLPNWLMPPVPDGDSSRRHGGRDRRRPEALDCRAESTERPTAVVLFRRVRLNWAAGLAIRRNLLQARSCSANTARFGSPVKSNRIKL